MGYRPVGLIVAAAVLIWVLPAAWAENLGRMRVQRMDGTWLVGEVEETGDAYKISVRKGIVVTIKKNEVRVLLPEEGTPTGNTRATESGPAEPSFRRAVTDEEIQELLNGLAIEEVEAEPTQEELESELPVNEESVQQMVRLAGGDREKNVLLKPHFALVFTSSREDAMQLGSRLEAVYQWNLRFMRMLNLPVKRLEYKLEIFYFGTQKEFDAYRVNTGGNPHPGVLGFYMPRDNRSAFFELSTWHYLEGPVEMTKNKNVPFDQRQRAKNIIQRWVEFKNMEVIQHEAGHHIHFNIGLFPPDPEFNESLAKFQSVPRWLVEGTTMQFEVPPSAAGASLGSVNHYRLHEFRRMFRGRISDQFLKNFVVDNMAWFAGYNYPLGWSLVNYLWTKKRDGYAQYLKIISQREPGVEISATDREKEFEDCFGRIDEKWVEDWLKYMDSLHLRESLLPPDIRP